MVKNAFFNVVIEGEGSVPSHHLLEGKFDVRVPDSY